MLIYICEALSQKDAQKAYKQIKQWFADNPKRRVCYADLGFGNPVKIKRATIKEDILANCKPNVKLK